MQVFLTSEVFAQQNFINVPSSEITEQKKFFFQQQLNLNEILQTNTTLDYGLNHGFEIGINILGLNFSEQKRLLVNDTNDTDPYNPLALVNLNKAFSINQHLKLTTGFQGGFNFIDQRQTKFASLLYCNAKISSLIIDNDNYVLGVYYNSKYYGGNGNRFGLWLGTEMPITQRKHFMFESIIGYNALSYTSIGMVYYAKPQIPLTFAVQIPNTSSNSYSIVFELTIIPKSK